MQKDIKKIANHYGDKQFLQMVEELSELTKAICKYQRFSLPGYRNDIVDEIADVEIMTSQLKFLLNAESDVEKIKKVKIQRQLERIKQECENNATCNNSNAI